MRRQMIATLMRANRPDLARHVATRVVTAPLLQLANQMADKATSTLSKKMSVLLKQQAKG